MIHTCRTPRPFSDPQLLQCLPLQYLHLHPQYSVMDTGSSKNSAIQRDGFQGGFGTARSIFGHKGWLGEPTPSASRKVKIPRRKAAKELATNWKCGSSTGRWRKLDISITMVSRRPKIWRRSIGIFKSL